MFTTAIYSFVSEDKSERTNCAQDIHTAVMWYIKTAGSPDAHTNMVNVLNNVHTTVSTIAERSVNGYGILHDIFRVPFLCHPTNTGRASVISKKLFCLVMSVCEERKLNLAFRGLLLTATTEEITPLNDLLKTGSSDLITLYLDKIHWAYDNHFIDQADYRNYLVGRNSSGYTPLVSALLSKESKNFDAYIYAVKRALKNGIISKNDYVNLLIGDVLSNDKPLHIAAATGNLDLLLSFFDILEFTFKDERDVIATQLMHADNEDDLSACDHPESQMHAINRFLKRQREKYCSVDDEYIVSINSKRDQRKDLLDERKQKREKSSHYSDRNLFYYYERSNEISCAKELLDCCVNGNRKRMTEIIEHNPRLMFSSATTRDIDGSKILMSPLQYVIKNHNYHQYRIMRDNAGHDAYEFLEHARTQTEFFDPTELIRAYEEYDYFYSLILRQVIEYDDIKYRWVTLVGHAQRYFMPREMLQVMCGMTDDDAFIWHPDSNFDSSPPIFGSILYDDLFTYENNNDLLHFGKKELGVDFAYFRTSRNILRVDTCCYDTNETIQTIQRYIEMNKYYINASLLRLENSLYPHIDYRK